MDGFLSLDEQLFLSQPIYPKDSEKEAYLTKCY